MQFFGGVPLSEKFNREVYHFIGSPATSQLFCVVTVKVRADTHVVNADKSHDMIDMCHGVQNRRVGLFA